MPTTAMYTVTGRFLTPTGSSVPGAAVQAICMVSLRSTPARARSTTSADGAFTLIWTETLPDGAAGIDFYIASFDGDVETARSRIVFDARGGTFSIDLVLANAEYIGRTEYERIDAAVRAVIAPAAPEDLSATDFQWVAGRSDTYPVYLAQYIQAHKLAHAHKIPARAFYGMARGGLSLDLAVLLAQGEPAQRNALEQAYNERIIPPPARSSMDAEIAGILGALRRLVVESVLAVPADPSGRSFRKVLDVAGYRRSHQEQLVQMWLDSAGAVEGFWISVRTLADFGDTGADLLQFTLQASALTNQHIPALKGLAAKRASATLGSTRDLAAWTVSDWVTFLEEDQVDNPGTPIGAPEYLPGEEESERIHYYAATLARIVEDMYPTAVLARRIEVDRPPHTAHVATFLDANPDFDVTRDALPRYLAENPRALSSLGLTTAEESELRDNLGVVQRIHNITPRFAQSAATRVLLTAGITSAQEISLLDAATFIDQYGPRLERASREPGATLAGQIYANAVTKASAAELLLSSYAPAFHAIQANVLTTPLAGLGDDPRLPTLEDLFGSLDYCACEACQSLLSPAAYLVDLLRFLKTKPAVAAPKKAVDVLFRRRPDIKHLELSCKSTNTLLPYIDLVNELLEDMVATYPAIKIQTGRQTTGTADELRINPEHQNDDAYTRTGNVFYPWSLPFRLPLVESRAYFEHLGAPRHELMKVFQRASTPPDSAIVAEYLGMSRPERNIIVNAPGVPPPARYWKRTPAPGWHQALKDDVELLLRTAGLTFSGLETLLTLDFIDPGGTVGILFDPADSCRLADAQVKGFSDSVAARLHRFVRLWRRLGLPVRQVNALIMDLGSGALNATFLARLVSFLQLERRLHVGVYELLAWWNNLDTRPQEPGTLSLYDRLFQNPEVIHPVHPDFAVEALAGQIEAAQVPTILAALRISEEDLGRLTVTDNSLSLANLSRLFRNVSAARAFKLTIQELLDLTQITGIDPFASSASARRFETAVSALRTAGFSIAELDDLTRHRFDPLAGIGVGPVDAAHTLAELLGEYHASAEAFSYTENSVKERTLEFLAIVFAGETDPEATVETTRQILAKETNLTLAEQTDFINTEFAAFMADTSAAVEKLVAPDPETDVHKRFAYTLDLLIIHLQHLQRIDLLSEFMARSLGLTRAAVDILMGELLDHPDDQIQGVKIKALFLDPAFAGSDPATISAETHPHEIHAYVRLHKAALLVRRFEIPPADLTWFFTDTPPPLWLDLNALPLVVQAEGAQLFAAWHKLSREMDLRTSFRGEGNAHQAVAGAADLKAALDVLAERTGWNREDLTTLTSASGLDINTFPGDFRDEAGLLRIRDAMAMVRRLGVSAAELVDWAQNAPSFARARAIKSAVKAKYGDDRWPEVARPLRDSLREQQRDALTAYLLGRGVAADQHALFGRLLIDTEMSACMQTSRLKQAISSAQLFIQRVFLGLEHSRVIFGEGAAGQWAWLKNYRVWEANRKVFLYPENWIEPELRDDKTPLFKAFEEHLLQGETTPAHVEDGFRRYLQGLHEIGHLEVVGVYLAPEGHHVIARTRGIPPVYYHRLQEQFHDVWTAWQEIPLEIEGDNVVPVVYRNRLFLFWLTVHEDRETLTIADEGTEPARIFRLQVNWSFHRDGAWRSKRTVKPSREFLAPPPQHHADRDGFYAVASAGTRLSLTMYYSKTQWLATTGALLFARYFYNDATEMLELDSWQSSEELADAAEVIDARLLGIPKRSRIWGQQFRRINSKETWLHLVSRVADEEYEYQNVLHKADRRYSVVVPHNAPFASYASDRTLFFDDGRHAFYIIERNAYGGGGGQGSYEPEKPCGARIATGDKTHTRYFDRLWKVALAGLDTPPPATPRPPRISTRAARYLDGLHEVALWGGKLPGFKEVLASQGDYKADDRAAPEGYIATALGQALDVLGGRVATQSEGLPLMAGSRYTFHEFHHPYTRDLLSELNRQGVDGLLAPASDAWSGGLKRQLVERIYFLVTYHPNILQVNDPDPRDTIEFAYGAPYGQYNWELFFHAPFYIANQLSRNQKFAEAQRWYHYIFNPFDTSSSDKSRFWNVKPLYQQAIGTPMNSLLVMLGYQGTPAQQEAAKDDLLKQVEAWRKNPFNPHLLARLRPGTYQRAILRKYLDNLIAWGDSLFRIDTIETINEATQLYILAAEILGPRPAQLPKLKVPVKTFADIADSLDAFGNALVKIEGYSLLPWCSKWGSKFFPFPWKPKPPVLTPYFCLPPNDALLAYWDLVDDRLFKIRHCLNIEGARRELPLFEPPIDPALLVKAAASGVDLASAISGLNTAITPYRFRYVLQQALGLCSDVQSLGSALLQALEKRDAEALALIQAGHQTALLKAIRRVRVDQITEAREALESLRRARVVVESRRDYHASRVFMIDEESEQIKKLESAQSHRSDAQTAEKIAQVLGLIPDFVAGLSGFTGSPVATLELGGTLLATVARASAASANARAGEADLEATKSSLMGGYKRRADEWAFQAEQARQDIAQIDKQIDGATVRAAIVERELENHDLQAGQAADVEAYMRDKFTNSELYAWMTSQLSSLYFQSYQLAHDMAKKAERAYRFELGLEDSNFIQVAYWDSLKKGLLAGERLRLDLQRMDAAFTQGDTREYELTKIVSLAQLDATALVRLREVGSCDFELPEVLFDLDHPGHYMRRIKSVSLTIPAVTGPFTTLGAKLTLVKHATRVTPNLLQGPVKYARQEPDARFREQVGSLQAVATSTGLNDSGLFELNFRDERYLPFEGAGTITQWRIELPAELPQFDYRTIADVVVTIHYTARDGGDILRDQVNTELRQLINAIASNTGLTCLLSARHDFPEAWNQFLYPPESQDHQELALSIDSSRLPFLPQGKTVEIDSIVLVLVLENAVEYLGGSDLVLPLTSPGDTLVDVVMAKSSNFGKLPTGIYPAGPQSPGVWTIDLTAASLANVHPAVLETGGTHTRLHPAKVRDLLALVHYKLGT